MTIGPRSHDDVTTRSLVSPHALNDRRELLARNFELVEQRIADHASIIAYLGLVYTRTRTPFAVLCAYALIMAAYTSFVDICPLPRPFHVVECPALVWTLGGLFALVLIVVLAFSRAFIVYRRQVRSIDERIATRDVVLKHQAFFLRYGGRE